MVALVSDLHVHNRHAGLVNLKVVVYFACQHFLNNHCIFPPSPHFLLTFSLQASMMNKPICWPLGYFSTEMFMGWLLGIHVCSMSPGSWLKARDAALRGKERMLQCHLHLGQKHTWMCGQQRKQTVPLYILFMRYITVMVTSRELQQVASYKYVNLVRKSLF